MNKSTSCHHCEGKGYTEIRDCGGDIQRTDRCSFCEGLGYVNTEETTTSKSDLKINKSN